MINMATHLQFLVMVLSIGSLNLHGSAKGRLKYVNDAMQALDILAIQEHWLHSGQIDTLQSDIDDVCVH